MAREGANPSGVGNSMRALLIGGATLFLPCSRSIVKELGMESLVAIFRPLEVGGIAFFFFDV